MKKKSLIYVLSFLIPVAYMIVFFAHLQIWPGGPYTVLIYDLKYQYASMYASLRYLGSSHSSFWYNTFGSLGSSAVGNYAYYLGNPLLFLAAAFPLSKLPDVLYFLSLLKIGACGLTFSVFLMHAYPDRRKPVVIVLLSVCYALMSYNLMYLMSLMWMDGVILLPLILLGIERILKDRSPFLFFISFLLSFLLNYYITFMSACFTVLYFFWRFVCLEKKKAVYVVRAFCAGILSIGISLPILLPTIAGLLSGRLKEDADGGITVFEMPLLKVLGQFFSSHYDTLGNDGLPSLFCGTGALLLFLCFFFCRKIALKKRFFALGIFVFYIVGFCFEPLYMALHGFRLPNCFPGRFSYVICFFVLVLAYEAYPEVSSFLRSRSQQASGLLVIWILFTAIELFLNGNVFMTGLNNDLHYANRREYDSLIERTQEALSHIPEDDSFYRIGKNYAYSYEDSFLFGYNGISYFSSSYHLNVMNLFGDLGLAQNYNMMSDNGLTPVTESLFGVKYYLSYYVDIPGLDQLFTGKTLKLYENPDALGLGYAVSDEARESALALPEDPFEAQNEVLGDYLDQDSKVFVPVDFTEEVRFEPPFETEEEADLILRESVITFTARDDNPVWLYFAYEAPKAIEREDEERIPYYIGKLSINGEGNVKFMEEYCPFAVCLGTFTPREEVRIVAAGTKEFGDAMVVSFDREAYSAAISRLQQAQFSPDVIEGGHYAGNVTMPEDSDLLVTLPYEDDFRITVDGSEVSYGSYRDALLLIPVPAGDHRVEITYVPPGVKAGTVISVMCLIIAAMWLSFFGRVGVKRKERIEA
ncbi:MAG: YfhO family protein [Lachnospiraceae bacterium]|nr:YfhO family protein [Lachnospiraceae bacterium]